MIEVVLIRNVFEGAKRAERIVHDRHTALVGELLPESWQKHKDNVVPVRGVKRVEWDVEVESGDRIAFVLAPRGIDPATWALFIFIQLASAIVMRALLPKQPKQREDNSSPTYGYNGIEPNRIEGEPIPVYYGELRVGGQIINEFVDDFGAGGSQYNALISLGEGPLQKIAGQTADTTLSISSESSSSVLPYGAVWVNDSDAQDLPGVEVQTRMGTLEQSPVPGFAFSSSLVSVDTELALPTQTAAAWTPILNYNSPQFLADGTTGSNATWTNFGLTYSMTVEGEEAVFKLYSPEGQYFVTTGGLNLPGYTGIAVRYIELDGGGAPITTGGPQGDGYVRLRYFKRKENLQPGSVFDIKVPLCDPQTFTLPALGAYLDFNAGGAFRTGATSAAVPTVQKPYLQRTGALTVPITGPAWPTAGGNPESFTIEGFYYFRSLEGSGSAIAAHRSRLTSVPTSTSWLALGQIEIGNTSRTYSPAAGQSVTRYVPFVKIATGTQFQERDNETFSDVSYQIKNWSSTVDAGGAANPDILVQATFAANTNVAATAGSYAAENVDYGWQHFVFTYQADAVGTQNRVQLYINGIKIIDRLTSTDAVLPALATPALAIRGPGGNGRLKNVAIYKGVMDQDTVTRQWNNGNGRTFINTALVPVIFFSGTTTTTDESGNGNTLTAVPSDAVNWAALVPTSRSDVAVIEGTTSGTQTVKKSKYKVEVLRSYYNSTNTSMFDTLYWRSLSIRTYDPYSYPTAPLVAVTVNASSEINGNVPRITTKIQGRQVPVWDGVSLEYPTFNVQYSANPAWVVVDMLLNKEWGLGNTFENTDLEIATFADWASHCDEIIYSQTGYTVSYGTSSTPGTLTWRNFYYNASDSAYGLLPTITFLCPKDSIPDNVKVGEHIGVYGATVVTGFADFNNTSTTGGYEILAFSRMSFSGAEYDSIICRYVGAAPCTSLAFWTNELTTFGGGAPAGTIQSRHERFRFDGAIDTQTSAWDTLLLVCSSARATPIRNGRKIRVAVHKARPVIEVVGPSQIEEGTFEMDYLSPATRFNQIEIGFLDRDLNFERSMVSTEHDSIQGTTNSGLLRRKQFFQEGVVRRAQIARQAKFLLNQEYEIRRKGRFIGSVDLLALEPLDVFRIAHDVADRGTSGRVFQDSALATEIYLDQEVVLAAATTYKVTLRSASAPAGTAPEQLTVTSAAGIYSIGSPLTVATGFVELPKFNDVFVLNIDGADLLAQVDSVSLTPELKREVQWTEYVEAVYDVETPGTTPDIGTEFLTADSPALGSQSAPQRVSFVSVEEVTARGPGGAHQPRLAVTWAFEDGASDQTAGFDIWLAEGTRPPYYFENKVQVGPRARSAFVPLEQASVGQIYTVAVCARSTGQIARAPERGTKASVRIRGKSPAPTAPAWDSSYAAVMDGEQATYRIVPGSMEQGSSIEVRRGGWILGQRVGGMATDTGKLGPTPNWASAVNTSLSAKNHLHGLALPGAQYYARAISPKGKLSPAAVTSWAPRVINAETVTDSGNNTYYTRSWEDYGIGWRRSGPVTPNATLSGCQVTTSTLFPQGYLEFSGSNLTATYTTASGLVPVDQRSEWWYNSAFAIVEQIWPTTWANATYPWDDNEAQWTWEGPMNTLENGDDPGRVTCIIETRVMDEDGTYSDWQQQTPGKVRGIQAQWRLTMTRPTTAYNIRVYHFATQLMRIPRQRFERSGIQYFAEHQIFGRT